MASSDELAYTLTRAQLHMCALCHTCSHSLTTQTFIAREQPKQQLLSPRAVLVLVCSHMQMYSLVSSAGMQQIQAGPQHARLAGQQK
jgi:hypothetical protein